MICCVIRKTVNYYFIIDDLVVVGIYNLKIINTSVEVNWVVIISRKYSWLFLNCKLLPYYYLDLAKIDDITNWMQR